MLFPRVLDVKERWRLGYALCYFEQSCWMWRLGPDVCVDLKHSTMHFFLDLTYPSHEKVARRLLNQAVHDHETDGLSRIWNLRLSGSRKQACISCLPSTDINPKFFQIQENANMWAVLLTGSATPTIEFDYMGEDSSIALGKSDAGDRSLSTSERMESRSWTAKRLVSRCLDLMELSSLLIQERLRCLQFCGYWKDFPPNMEKPYCPPQWASLEELNKNLVHKPPWLSAWDRMVRRVLSLQPLKDREMSPLKSFYEHHLTKSASVRWVHVQVGKRPLITHLSRSLCC